MTCWIFQAGRALSLGVALLMMAEGSAVAALITGPTSPYYGSNYSTQSIFVVQGLNVINSFPWAYGGVNQSEGSLAVTDTVRTHGFCPTNGCGGLSGQYALDGTPTGTTYTYPTPSGLLQEFSYDGTSDGQHNYYVQYFGIQTGSGAFTETVYRTDLDWQNPVALFSVQSLAGATGEYLGITYDRTNNSLWISGWGITAINNYAMDGTLLSSFSMGHGDNGALALDPADNTLWISNGQTNLLEQYSKTGTLLQSGTLSGLPSCCYLGGEFAQLDVSPTPEPTTVLLWGTTAVGLALARWRRRRQR